MPARQVREPIPNLINGVSQQPASLRLSSQSEAQTNILPDAVEGARYRPPTNHVAKLQSGMLDDAFIHTINRDSVERYVVVLTAGAVQVWDIEGNAQTVNYMDRTQTLQKAATSTGDGASTALWLPSGTTSVDISSTIETTATITWETSALGDFTDAVTLATHTASTSETKTITSGHVIRARISSWTSGSVDASVTFKDVSYLKAGTPSKAFRATTVQDYTFIANAEITVAMDEVNLSDTGPGGALVSIKQVSNNIDYEIFIDGVSVAQYTTSASGAVSTAGVAADLESDLNTNLGAGWTINRQGSAVHIIRDDGSDFEIKVVDSRSNTYMNVAKTTVQQFSNLPVVAPSDFVVEVAGDNTNDFDNYYVKFRPNNDVASFDEGVWVEAPASSTTERLQAPTMPHQLVREADGTFTFGAAEWGTRAAGDLDSAPNPSFVGSKINDVFFFKNRLGLLADENYILSRAGEFFEFFRSTVQTLLDSDPVDASVAHTKVSVLKWAVAWDKQLLLFSEKTQFAVSGEELLTPQSADADVTTEYEMDSGAKPVGVGKNVLFAVKKGAYSGVREFFVTEDAAVDDAADVTAHVPAYVPSGPIKFAAAVNEGLVIVLTTGDRTKLYPYKFYWNGDRKLQSAWGTWTFNGDTILNIDFIETELFLVIQRDDGVYLEKLDVQPKLADDDQSSLGDSDQYLTHIDRRVKGDELSPAYDSMTDRTTWTLPYEAKDGVTMKIATRYHSSAPDNPGVLLQDVSVNDVSKNEISAAGDKTGAYVYIGEQYEARYRFSEAVYKEQAGEGRVLAGADRLTVGMYTLFFSKTGFFRVEVTHPYRFDPSVYKFTGFTVGSANNSIGSVSLDTGQFSWLVNARSSEVVVDLVADSHLPFSWQSAVWTGTASFRNP